MIRCPIPGCFDPSYHQSACIATDCKGCQPRHATRGQLCTLHYGRLSADLTDIPDLHTQLATEPGPHDTTPPEWLQQHPNPTTDPTRLPPWRWTHDPVLASLPAGHTTTGHGPRVTGSKNPPTPLGAQGINRLDLTGPARPGTIHPAPSTDQTGHLSAETRLDYWTRDIINTRNQREHLPPSTAAALTGWLRNRLDWTASTYHRITEYTEAITQIRQDLYTACGLNPPKREHCKAVPCRNCDRITLWRDDGYIKCSKCHTYYTEREYHDWVGLLAAAAKQQRKAA